MVMGPEILLMAPEIYTVKGPLDWQITAKLAQVQNLDTVD